MQSVLAIPFTIPPVAEAAGEGASSADGAFEASFAADAPRLPTTDSNAADVAALGIGVVPNVSPAMATLLAGKGPGLSFGGVKAMEPGPSEGVMPEVGLQSITDDAAGAIDFAVTPELQVLADVGPQKIAPGSGASAPHTPRGRGDPSTPDLEPLAPDAFLTGSPDLQPVASFAPILTAAASPEVTSATEPRRIGVADHSSIVAQGSSVFARNAGESVAVLDASTPTARKTVPAADVAARMEPGARVSAMPDRDMDSQQALAVNRDEPLPVAKASGALGAESLGHPALPVEASPPPSGPVGPGAAMDSRSVRRPVPTTPEIADGGQALDQTARSGQSSGEILAETPVKMETRVASTVVFPAHAVAEAKAFARPGAQLSDQQSEAEEAGAERSDRMPAPTAPTPTTPAGFWERVFTGLSATEPGNRVSPGTGLAAGNDAGSRPEVGTDHAAEVLTPTLPIPPATGDRPASGLTIFARSQALHAGPADQPAPNGEETGLTAISLPLLPGTAGQSMSQPAASAPGPMQLPFPQVAAQITAALSQTADGATELALSPEELGNVRVRLERDSRNPERMVVHITFERPETLDLFRRHAGELTEALRDAGYAGADIGFGREGSSADTSERDPGFAAPDYGSGATGASDPQTADPSAPRLLAGASLDLRL